jgi:hypothetical protein
MFAEKRGLITGAHRSGTTWLGRVVAKAPDVSVLHEPFNRDWGMAGVPSWYPYWSPAGEGPVIDKLVCDLLSGRAKYVRNHATDNFIKARLRRAIGGRSELQYRRARLAQRRNLILKDPLALLLTPRLATQYGFKAVILVRHPGAFLVSLRRMSWESTVDWLSDKKEFVRAHAPYLASIDAGSSVAYRTGLFWRALYSFAIKAAEDRPEAVRLARHEDLSLDPVVHLSPVLSHLGIDDISPSMEFAMRSTMGDTILPPAGKLHEFERDAKSLMTSWQSEIAKDEMEELRQAAAPIVDRLYPDMPWP